MTISITKLRQNIYSEINKLIKYGQVIEIERNGHKRNGHKLKIILEEKNQNYRR